MLSGRGTDFFIHEYLIGSIFDNFGSRCFHDGEWLL